MAKKRLSLEETKDLFLFSTGIENLFINEFLPAAPGDYVKVFIFGLMCARHGQEIDTGKLALILGISEQDVEEAWIYWEAKGLVRIVKDAGTEENGIVFISQIEALYGRAPKITARAEEETAADEETGGDEAEDEEPESFDADDEGDEEDEDDEEDIPLHISIDNTDFDEVMNARLVDRRLRDLYQKYQMTTGRTVSRQETSRIEDAIKVYGIEPDIFDFAIDYCADLGKFSIDYIFKVALRWTEDGCRTVADAKKLLDRHSRRNSWYRQVFKELGFNRLPAPADREIMDRWFDGMGFSIEEVLDACVAAAGIRDPNLRYVNKILENRKLEKGGVKVNAAAGSGTAAQKSQKSDSPVSRKVLADYFEYIRTTEEKALESRTEKVLAKVPEMKEIFEAERSLSMRLLSMKPGKEGADGRQRLRAERVAIEEKKKQLLAENGFTEDYLNRRYRCGICRDSGYTDEGKVCSCCRERAAEAYEWHTGKEKA